MMYFNFSMQIVAFFLVGGVLGLLIGLTGV
jgi:hypothetical protein